MPDLGPAVPSEPTTPADALRNLVAGIDRCRQAWDSALVMAQIHGSQYSADDISIEHELNAARETLARGEVGPSPEQIDAAAYAIVEMGWFDPVLWPEGSLRDVAEVALVAACQ